MLEVKNLKKKYGKNLVLKGIDLKVEKGDRIAIIFADGSVSAAVTDSKEHKD